MIHRLALLVGGLAAAAVLAYGLLRGDEAALSANVDESPPVATADDTTATPEAIVDTVYIAAPRKPKVIHVTRRAKSTPRPAARSTRRDSPRRASDGDDEHEDREHEDREHEDREHEDREREDDD
jgi:hypothetical protein